MAMCEFGALRLLGLLLTSWLMRRFLRGNGASKTSKENTLRDGDDVGETAKKKNLSIGGGVGGCGKRERFPKALLFGTVKIISIQR